MSEEGKYVFAESSRPARSSTRQELQNDHFPQPAMEDSDSNSILQPPSFSESQFATIIRRQRKRRIVSPTSERLESSRPADALSEVLNLSPHQSPSGARRRHQHHRRRSSPDYHLDTVIEESKRQPKLSWANAKTISNRNDWNDWQFSGWGSMMMLELSKVELEESRKAIDARPKPVLEWARAAAIAGNALTGSVFYSIPAVLAACTIFTPLSLLLAVLLLWPFRPIMCQLAQTMQNGDASSYTYLLNTVQRSWLALIAAAFILLDAIATGSVSAATAASYISNQVDFSRAASSSLTTFLQGAGIVIVLLAGMALITLLGLRDSASIALVMITIHLLTMFALIIAGVVQWARQGNGTLTNNWHEAVALLSQGRGIARSIFDGTCIAFVGLTGFEMTPTYVSSVKEGHFKIALRNLHLATLLTEVPLALLVVALIPLNTGLAASNVLAVLAQICSSPSFDGPSSWLKIIVVIDAVIVLMGGVMTGIQATCGLCQSLAYDGVLASVFLRRMIKTNAFFMSIGLFLVLSLVFCAVFQFNMATMSSVFSLTFLFVMTSFPVSLFLLKWCRPRLEEKEDSEVGATRCGMACVTLGLAIGIIAIAGNVALQPMYLLKTAALALGIFLALWILKRRVELARCFMWLTHEGWFAPPAMKQRSSGQVESKNTNKLQGGLVKWMKRERTKPVVFFTKTDEISHLVNALRYVDENETTSRVIMIHCFSDLSELPSELEANIQLVDEAFPKITVDLIFIEADFSPVVVEAISRRLGVPKHRFFLACPSRQLREYGSLRIIVDDL